MLFRGVGGMNSDFARLGKQVKREIFYGWWVVLAAFLMSAIVLGSFYSYGVFFVPIMTEFDWTRGLMSGVPLVGGLTYAVTVPATGWLADRCGFRKVTTIMAGILTLGFILSSQVKTLWQLYLFAGFMGGLGAPTAIALPLSMVTRWFVRRRGLALGIASAGIGAGTALIPPLVAYLINNHEWRVTYMVLGLLIGLICIPAALITMRQPEPKYVLAFEGRDSSTSSPPAPSKGDEDYSLAEALFTGSFWSLFAVFALCIFSIGLALTHLVPYAQDRGLSAVRAASLLSTLGIFSIIGRLASGALSDRVGARVILFAGFALQGVAMLWLIRADVAWMLYMFAGLFGVLYGGTFVVIPKLTSHIFGLKSMGAIFGALSVADGLGYGTGPLLAGYLFDATGSYDIPFLIVAGGMALALLLTLVLKEEPAQRDRGKALSRT